MSFEAVCSKVVRISDLEKLPSNLKRAFEVFPRQLNVAANTVAFRFNQAEIVVSRLNKWIGCLNQELEKRTARGKQMMS